MVNVALSLLVDVLLVGSVLTFGIWTLVDFIPQRHRTRLADARQGVRQLAEDASRAGSKSPSWERPGLAQRVGRP